MFPRIGRLAALAAASLCTGALAQPAPLKDLKLTDHHARPLEAAGLRGRPTLLHFVYTTCSTSCPVQVRELGAVRQALPDDVRARVRFVSVTVDPLQDTPASLAAFAQRLGADQPGWHFVTGPGAFALADRLQVLTAQRPRAEDHRTSLYLYDARGALVQRYGGMPVDRARLTEEITHVARTTR